MIPISDNMPSRGRPWMTYLLLAANAAVFIYQMLLPVPQLNALLNTYGVIPARIGSPLTFVFPQRWPQLLPLLTAMFLHGGWLHFGGNMLYLWIFGDNVEASMGSGSFLVFYLLTGALGNVCHVVFNLRSMIPTIGASGAIAGILGAYLVLFPRARVLALVPLGFFFTVAEIPAMIFLLFWFLLQVLSGIFGAAGPQAVAWWAHIGGFVAGIILVLWFGRNVPSDSRRRRGLDESQEGEDLL